MTYIEDIGRHEGQKVTLRGWLHARRSSGKIHFLILRDGTGFIQAVVTKQGVDEATFKAADHLSQETSLTVEGTVRADRRAPGGYELDVTNVDPRVVRVVDIKTPGSKESERNRLENLPDLRATDQLKFVICDRADYDWSRRFIAEHGLVGRCPILFSPSHEQLKAVEAQERSQQRAADIAEARYRQGVGSFLEVLDAQRQLFAVRQGLIQLRRTQWSTAAQLYKALGGEQS